MKKIFLSTILLLSLIACGGDDTPSSALFKAKIDGSLLEADAVSAYVIEGNTNSYVNITGTDDAGKTITLTNSDIQTGNHSLVFQSNSGSALAYNESNNSADSYVAGFSVANSTGFINVTEIDYNNKLISGTFEAHAQNGAQVGVEITEGVFRNIPFETELNSVGNNSFYAEVDGVEFAETSITANEVTVGPNTNIIISANVSVNETIGITIPMSNSTSGTYNFSVFPTADAYTGLYNINSNTYSTVSGSITINSHDTTSNHIEGTFFFTAQPLTSTTPSFNVTNGTFSVNY